MKKGFTQLPNNIIFNKRVSDGAFRTYAVLKSFKYGKRGRSFPSQQWVARLRVKSRETVNRHVQSLARLGLLRVKKRGYSSSNEYSFNCDDNVTSTVTSSSPQKLGKLYTNNTKVNNTKFNKGMQLLRRKLEEKGLKR